LEKVPESIRQERRWVAYLGDDATHTPESEMGLAGGASLADASTWLDAAGAIDLVRSNRGAKGIAFVTGDGWYAYVLRHGLARASTQTGNDLTKPDPRLMDHDWHEPSDDGTDDARVLTRTAVDTSEPVNPRYRTEVRWADHGHQLMAFPVPTITTTPDEPLTMAELLELAEDAEGYADAVQQAQSDPKPLARLLFATALAHGVPSRAHATDVVSEVMGNLNLPLSKRELDTLYTAAKSTAPGRVKQRKVRAKSDDERAFIDDIDHARQLGRELIDAGHRYCWQERRWLLRDGRTGLLRRSTADEHHGIQNEAFAFTQHYADVLDLGKRSAAVCARGLAFTATNDPSTQVSAELLDEDPNLVGVPSGVYDLRTGETRAARNGELVTRSLSVDPDPDYADGLWCSDFLPSRVPDAQHRRILQLGAGYCLSGNRGAKVFFLLHGAANSGKSSFLETLLELFGSGRTGYAGPLENGIYSREQGDDDKRGFYDIVGKRLVVADELVGHRTLNERFVKALSTGATVQAEGKFQHPFSVRCQACLWLGTNELPRVRMGGEQVLTRVRLIPFDVVLPPDPTYRERLHSRAELAKVAGWAFAGWAMLQREGVAAMDPTDAMRDAADEWLNDAAYNPMRRFVRERVEHAPEPDAWLFSSDIEAEYETWRQAQRPSIDTRWQPQRFADAVQAAGWTASKVDGPAPAVQSKRMNTYTGKQGRGWSHLRMIPAEGLTPRPIDIPY
jgi:P4 family phage/plasmid primase-like protien